MKNESVLLEEFIFNKTNFPNQCYLEVRIYSCEKSFHFVVLRFLLLFTE